MSIKARAAALLAGIFLMGTAIADDSSWTDRIDLKGDLRLRWEGIDEAGDPERKRARYRVRVGLDAEVYEDVKLVFSLASGADDPVSRNVTFGDGFATDDFGLELAYVDWKINDELQFFGGKMKNPLFRAGGAPLIYDGDLNPEGFAMQYESGRFFGTAAVFLPDERSAADDSHLYAVQGGLNLATGEGNSLTLGAGFFTYTDTVGNEPFFDGSANGNSVDVNGNYLFDYENTELFAQYDIRSLELPLSVYAQWTQNSEVSVEDTALAFGVKLGSAKAEGTWQTQWTYQDIEADSVIGTYNDSDFGGGGTDASGHIIKARYMLRDQISLGGTLIISEVDRFQGVEHDYDRIQLDVEFKFK